MVWKLVFHMTRERVYYDSLSMKRTHICADMHTDPSIWTLGRVWRLAWNLPKAVLAFGDGEIWSDFSVLVFFDSTWIFYDKQSSFLEKKNTTIHYLKDRRPTEIYRPASFVNVYRGFVVGFMCRVHGHTAVPTWGEPTGGEGHCASGCSRGSITAEIPSADLNVSKWVWIVSLNYGQGSCPDGRVQTGVGRVAVQTRYLGAFWRALVNGIILCRLSGHEISFSC